MDISKISELTQLKALAYDQLVAKETATSNLVVINERIKRVMSEVRAPKVEETKKTTKNLKQALKA